MVGKPILVSGKVGTAISLNGKSQFLKFDKIEKAKCISDLDLCTNGLSTKMVIQFNEFKENMFFLSSGGESTSSAGCAMFFK